MTDPSGEGAVPLPRLLYLDTSALAKLVQAERETEPLRAELVRWPEHATSVVGDVELRRVARRAGLEAEAEQVLETVALVELDAPVRRRAAAVGDATLRSLDAIHLASALSLGEVDLGFACYDARLTAAAEQSGLRVVAPVVQPRHG